MKLRSATLAFLLLLAVNTEVWASTKSGAYSDLFNGVGIAFLVGAVMGAIAAVFRLPQGRTVLVSIGIAFVAAVFVDVYWDRVFPDPGGAIFDTSWKKWRGALIVALLAVPLPTFLAFSFTSQFRVPSKDHQSR